MTVPERMRSWLRRLGAGFWWGVAAVAVAILPVAGAVSTTRIFFLRDLSFYFWPEHLWVRNALWNGEFPLWDPYVGCGQAAVSDPVRHLLYPPIALLRFVPSAELGFNLAVALPFPLAALGMYLFLKRQVRPRAAALGAVAFAASGPMLSTGNILNFSWAAATIPWVLLAVEMLAERPTPRRFALLAVAYAMLLLAGEGPMLIGTAVLSASYAFTRPGTGGRLRGGARVIGAGLCGLALSGVLAVPFFLATLHSPRAGGADPRVPTFWSLHPLSLFETVSFGVLGDPMGQTGEPGWQFAMNGGYEPFVYSVYFGIAVLALAVVGSAGRIRRWDGIFWTGAVVATVAVALGRFTPLYGGIRSTVPAVDALRFPSKFVVIAAVAVAVLSAFGWENLGGRESPEGTRTASRAGRLVAALLSTVGLAAFAATGLVIFGSTAGPGEGLASLVGMPDPAGAREFLDASLRIAAPRLGVLAIAVAVALVAAGSAEDRFRRSGLIVLMLISVADPVLTGSVLNPLGDARNLVEPAWAGAVRDSGSRIYVGGRLRFTVDRTPDPDDVAFARGIPVTTDSPIESSAAFSMYTATFPSAWRVRDAVSFDNAMLWPREYWYTRERLRAAPFDARRRFLARAAVGWYLVPWQEVPGATRLGSDPRFRPQALWREDRLPSRLAVATDWIVEPDVARAIESGFEPRTATVVDRLVEACGAPGEPMKPEARFAEDGSNRVVVEASVPDGGGLLVLRDTFAPGWSATVDGAPAPMLRADGLFRGVMLSPGAHRVEFRYEPPGLRLGIALTSVTALALAFAVLVRRVRNADCR